MSITEVITYLKTNIEQTDITLFNGAPSSLIAELESSFEVKLPNDIKQFYEFTNGFESAEDLFRIIPIEEILEERLGKTSTEINMAEYLVYCDVWNLEIDNSNHNLYCITNLDKYNNKLILTTSFAEFIDRFLKGGVFEPGLYSLHEEIRNKNISNQ